MTPDILREAAAAGGATPSVCDSLRAIAIQWDADAIEEAVNVIVVDNPIGHDLRRSPSPDSLVFDFIRRVKSTPDPDTSRYISHFYRDAFAKVCPLLGRK